MNLVSITPVVNTRCKEEVVEGVFVDADGEEERSVLIVGNWEIWDNAPEQA